MYKFLCSGYLVIVVHIHLLIMAWSRVEVEAVVEVCLVCVVCAVCCVCLFVAFALFALFD